MSLLAAYVMPHPPLAIPDIGRGSEAKIPQTIQSYYQIGSEIASLEPDTIVIVSPHATTYAETFAIAGDEILKMSMASFGSPLTVGTMPSLTIDSDQKLAREIKDKATAKHLPVILKKNDKLRGSERVDHGSFVPLFFVALSEDALTGKASSQELHLRAKVVRLSFSGLSEKTHHEYGTVIRDAIQESGKRVVFIASGDLSHRLKEDGPYGLSPRAKAFDKDLVSALAVGDFARLMTYQDDLLDEVAECGLRSINILGGVIDGADYEPELLSYEDTYGVGYAQAAFRQITWRSQESGESERASTSKQAKAAESKQEEVVESKQAEAVESKQAEAAESKQAEAAKQISWLAGLDPYVALARYTVETYVRSGSGPLLSAEELAALPPEMSKEKAGTFVSLHSKGNLRGCIGTIQPYAENIAEEIIDNAISASTKDFRFNPVKEIELDSLEYSVDVLTTPERIDSINELDPKRYGVIVSRGSRRGLLLPDLEGVDTAKMQVDIARQKAGISPDEELTLERFQVIRHR